MKPGNFTCGLRVTSMNFKNACKNSNYDFLAKSFVEFIRYLFSLPEVKSNKPTFLSNIIGQDTLENCFGCHRQKGGTSDNPTIKEYYSKIESLRVINSFCRSQVRGNCRGFNSYKEVDENDILPIPKRKALQGRQQ